MNLNQISPETIALHCQYPPEIKNKLLRGRCPQKVIEYTISSVLVAITLTQSSNNQDSHQIIDSLSNDLNIPEEDIIKSIGIYLKMINLLTHSADTKFNDKLTELGFSDDFVNDLPLIANRAKVMDGMFTLKQGIFNRLESLKWRVDISLIDR